MRIQAMNRHWLSLLLLLFMFAGSALAQEQDCVEKDIKDVFRKKSKDFVQPKIVIKKPSLILIPVIASSPATGFQLGVAGQGAWYNGPPEDTRISQASANVTVTAKSQVLITLKSTVMSNQDKWIWMGDWRYYFYSQSLWHQRRRCGYGI
jgi:hypothetical protein